MRSRKAGLSEVEKQFESWRSKPHGRLIPEELWNAAVGLLDRYTPSASISKGPSFGTRTGLLPTIIQVFEFRRWDIVDWFPSHAKIRPF